MRYPSFLLGLSPLLSSVSATFYVQSDLYEGAGFFDKFNFFTDDDPTGGYVDYKSQADAASLGLISTTAKSAKWGVGLNLLDPNDNTIRGRSSVRLEGKTSYTKGLFVADIAHMPGNACGIWPSFWTLGSGPWPHHGEIDIIEGVNHITSNKYSLHSGSTTCAITSSNQLGSIASTDCQTIHNGNMDNFVGCGVQSSSQANFGTPFNANNGGTYAMQWTDNFIKTWFFPRGSEPPSLKCSAPDVTEFGTPDSFFSGCDIGSNFLENRLVFTTTFCGTWAGANGVYSSSCPLTFPASEPEWKSCRAQVATHPETFLDGFWEVNSIKIFDETTTPPTCSAPSASSSSSHAQSSPSSSATASTFSSSIFTSSSATASSSSSVSSISVSTSSGSSMTSSVLLSASITSSNSSNVSSASLRTSTNSPISSFSSQTSSSPGVSLSFSSISFSNFTGSFGRSSSSTVSGSTYYYTSTTVSTTISKATSNSINSLATITFKDSYPAVTSPSKNFKPIKAVVLTVVTTDVVDVCPTGLTTSRLIATMTRCAMCQYNPTQLLEGFTTTAKVCTSGCGPKPTTITLTVPIAKPVTTNEAPTVPSIQEAISTCRALKTVTITTTVYPTSTI